MARAVLSGRRGSPHRAGCVLEAILQFAQQLYRMAQRAVSEPFEDLALAALTGQVPFDAALWFTGQIDGGRLQVHRLHAYRMPPAALEPLVTLVRQRPETLVATSGAHGAAHLEDAGALLGRGLDASAHEQLCRGRIERQLLIGTAACGTPGGEWLSLHRAQSGAPFDAQDCERAQVLMPHLSESRAVHRALCLRHASAEPGIAPGPHRALTLCDGTVLHCGGRLGEAIGARWPEWNGLRLPPGLLARAQREEAVPLEGLGEIIQARRFTDALVLSLRWTPPQELLTAREYEVARRFAAGEDYQAVARRCALAPATVRNVLRFAYRKLGINSRAQLVRLMRRAETAARLEIPPAGR